MWIFNSHQFYIYIGPPHIRFARYFSSFRLCVCGVQLPPTLIPHTVFWFEIQNLQLFPHSYPYFIVSCSFKITSIQFKFIYDCVFKVFCSSSFICISNSQVLQFSHLSAFHLLYHTSYIYVHSGCRGSIGTKLILPAARCVSTNAVLNSIIWNVLKDLSGTETPVSSSLLYMKYFFWRGFMATVISSWTLL